VAVALRRLKDTVCYQAQYNLGDNLFILVQTRQPALFWRGKLWLPLPTLIIKPQAQAAVAKTYRDFLTADLRRCTQITAKAAANISYSFIAFVMKRPLSFSPSRRESVFIGGYIGFCRYLKSSGGASYRYP
jgi:hypothetical protein